MQEIDKQIEICAECSSQDNWCLDDCFPCKKGFGKKEKYVPSGSLDGCIALLIERQE